MAGLNSSVDQLLGKMRTSTQTGKGTFGEQAVFKICEQLYQTQGGILVHSYSYKTDKDLAGNIKKDKDGKLFVENTGGYTEIDVLYVSKFRVFPIEVKAYKAKEITLKDDGIYGCYKTDKSPVHQNEMHCRHLYPHIFRALPNGDTNYVVPLICMVDKAKIIDARSEWQQAYIKLCVLNTLQQSIEQNNTPLEYQLNLQLMDSILKEAMTGSEKYLPPRI